MISLLRFIFFTILQIVGLILLQRVAGEALLWMWDNVFPDVSMYWVNYNYESIVLLLLLRDRLFGTHATFINKLLKRNQDG